MKTLIILILILSTTYISFSQNNALVSEKEPGEILWYHSVYGSAVKASNPVLTSEENIIWVKYKWAGVPNSEIFCFNPEGDTIWSKQFSERFEFDPMIIPQLGWIIIGSSSYYSKLFCLNPNGTERWNKPIPDELTQPPVTDTLFNIYIAVGTKLISYDSAGVFRWEYDSPVGEISTPLSVSQEGVIYFGTEWDKLVAVRSTGNEVSINDLFGYVRGTPTIDLNGTIYMSTSNIEINKSKIEAFNPDGSFIWEMTFNEPNPSAVIIGDSNYIYVRTMNFWGGGYGKLYKIDKTNQSVTWNFPYGPGVEGAWDPTLSINGAIYLSVAKFFSTSTGKYYAIDEDGNVIWELDPIAVTGIEMDIKSHMLIGDNGNIYAVTKSENDTTYLLAIEDTAAIIANTAWPMYKHDQHYSSLASNIVLPQPNIFIDKLTIDFGFIEPGNSSNDLLTIHNIGNLPLDLEWILDSDVFGIEMISEKVNANCKSTTIPPGDSILFNVTFSPADTTISTDTVFVFSNDPDQPIVNVILKGKSTIEGEIKWKLQLSTSSLSAPALDDFGNIYVAGTNKVWRIQPSGEIKWEYEPESENLRSDYTNITISHNNQLIFMPWGLEIISIDSSGIWQWSFNPPSNEWVYPLAINKAKQLFFSESNMYGGGGHLYCLNEQQGNEIWNYNAVYELLFPPAIEENGNIITEGIAGDNGKIFSTFNSGELNWKEYFLPSSPASIGFENMIYIGGVWAIPYHLPMVRSYNQAGLLNWEFYLTNENERVTSSIVTHPDGTLIFATSNFMYENGAVYAIDSEGNYIWKRQFNREIYSTPAVAKNGLICFGCDNGNFYVLHPDGSERWNINTESELATSPVINNNGMIYFTTESGYLYAVYGKNGGLANSPWPMVQHDPKHTSAADSLSVFIDEKGIQPISLKKMFAVPNPFDDNTIVKWSLNNRTEVKIMIFDLLGTEIISHKLSCIEGINFFVWDGTGKNGREVKSGVYICTLLTCDETSCIKLIKNIFSQ